MKKKLVSLSLACLLLTGCGGPESGSSHSQSAGTLGDSSQTIPPKAEYQVQTDWSVLEDESPLPSVQKRWYPDYTDHLIPGDRYGTLIPFAGAVCYPYYSWTDQGG